MENWRDDILIQLEKRNAWENLSFAELFGTLSTSSKTIKKYEDRNTELEQENQKLKASNSDLQKIVSTQSSGKPGPAINQKELDDLKNKLTEANEKMLNMLTKQDVSNQKVIELNEQLRSREDEFKKMQENELKLHETIASLEKQAKTLNEAVSNKEITVQVLQDEIQALQMEVVSRDERAKELEKENKMLLDRWLVKMNEESKRMNEMVEKGEKVNMISSLGNEEKTPIVNDKEPSSLLDQMKLYDGAVVLPSKSKRKIVAHDSEINAIQSSRNGKYFATGSNDRKIKIFESTTGNVRHTIRGCQQGVMCVEFSPNDDMILGASNDHVTRIWSIDTGRTRHTLTGHIGKVYTAKFSADSNKVISGSYDRTIKVWDLQRGFCLRTIFSFSSVNDLCMTDDFGNNAITGHLDCHVRFWDTKTGDLVNEISEIHSGQITSVCLSPDGTKILTNSRDNSLKLIDLKMFQVVSTYSAENFRTPMNWSRACFSPDGAYIAAGSSDGSLYIWNTSTTKLEKVLKDHSTAISSVSWSTTGDYVFTAEKDKHVVIWEP